MGLLGDKVKSFRGLRGLTPDEIRLLCGELREMIIRTTLKNGGHLGSSLGSVELIVALLRAYNPDRDKIIFDVGHQAYAYKILTDRMEAFSTLRTKGGIAGFPRMDESRYDFFTTGHSSTSISAATGYAKARDLNGGKHEVIAVIGDGALLNGESFEALNYLEHAGVKVIIILNDNAMSISPRIGGFAGHLARLAVHPAYRRLKEFIKEQCRTVRSGENIENKLARIKTKLKSLLLPSNIFEEMGVSYWGPFDGHNTAELEEVFELAKSYQTPLLIHVITKKGKGYGKAEENPSLFHGVSPSSDGPAGNEDEKKQSWSEVFSCALERLAKQDRRITVCTAAMADGTKTRNFAQRFPSRFFDVGIAEGHMLTYAAGLAAGGMRPAICIYSTFLQRAADQLLHDICIPQLPVLIGVDRAGFVGEDGETHQGLFDIAMLRDIPELTFAAPRDAADLEFLVRGWLERGGPLAIRYPRGSAKRAICSGTEAEWGKLELLRPGSSLCLIGVGSMVETMLEAADALRLKKIEAAVADLRFIKPLDWEALEGLMKSYKLIITAEEGAMSGGMGEAIAARSSACGHGCRVVCLGAPDRFISHATREQQLADCGLTAVAIAQICEQLL